MDESRSGALQVPPGPVARRPLLPGIIVLVAAVAFLVAAVAKPSATTPPVTALASATTAPDATSSSPAEPSRNPSPVPIEATAHDLLAASRPHDAWGVRSIVVPDPGGSGGVGSGAGLVERWVRAFEPESPDGVMVLTREVAAPGDAVLALGVTTPGLPLDVHVWRLAEGDLPRRIVPVPVLGPETGSWLWLPDPSEATTWGTWPGGTYRVDILLGAQIVRLVAIVPPTDAPVVTATAAPIGIPEDLPAALAGYLPEAFVTTATGVVWVPAAPGGLLDERTAWLATGRASWWPGVAQVSMPAISGLGYAFLPGDRPVTARLKRLGPDGPGGGFSAEIIEVPHREGDPTMAILVRPDGPGGIGTGLYRLTTNWIGSDGTSHQDALHFEVVPRKPPVPPVSPLRALGVWSELVGAGLPDPAVGQPLVTRHDLRPADGDGTCGDEARITGSTPLIGLVLPPDDEVVAIRLVAPDGYTQIDTRVMLPVHGLALMALPRGDLLPGTYRIDVSRATENGTAGTTYDVCIR